MSPTTNNDIYGLLVQLNGKLGDLTGTVRALDAKVTELRTDLNESDESASSYRRGMRDDLDKIVMRQTHMETDLLAVKNKVEAHEDVTILVKDLTVQAKGAGTLGRWALRVGVGVVGFIGWFVGLYTYLTGRPPP